MEENLTIVGLLLDKSSIFLKICNKSNLNTRNQRVLLFFYRKGVLK